MGRTIYTLTSGTGGGASSVNLNPTFFGNRAVQFADLYSRWKINRVIIKFLQVTDSSNGAAAIGFLDDVVTSNDQPTSLLGVAQLRCAITVPTTAGGLVYLAPELEWQPLRGPTKWFYTYPESAASSDARVEIPASLWMAVTTSSAATAIMEVSFSISYEGATDITST